MKAKMRVNLKTIIGGFKMVKKLFYVFMAFLFICAFTLTTTPVYAQEEEEVVEDVADISLEDLLNVEITTAGKQAEKIGEVPASVVVVTRDDIEKYGYQSVTEILENIPGLYYTDDYLQKSFGVRGFWAVRANRNVIILVNDVPQTDDVFSDFRLENIPVPVEAIDRVEVIRGPMSVIYGTGAVFGAINIITNIVDEANPINIIAASVGSEKTKRLALRASGKEGDFQYAFTGAYLDTSGINASYEAIAGPALAGLTTEDQLENDERYFNFSGRFKGFFVDASYSENNREVIFLLPSVSDGTLSTLKGTRFAFGYDREISDQFRIKAKFSYFEFRWLFFPVDWLFPGYWGYEDDGSNSIKFELNMFYAPSDMFNLTLGVDYYNIMNGLITLAHPILGFKNLRQGIADGENIVTQAIYAQLDFKISDKLKLVAGARLEQQPEYTMDLILDGAFDTEFRTEATYDFSDVQFIPRVALLFFPSDKHAIKLLYGKAINRPSLFYTAERLTVSGRPALVPETIQTFELNYVATPSPKFSIGLSVFHNILDKLIFRTIFFVGTTPVYYNSNVGEMTTTGAELTLTARPSESFQLELSGTYQDTKDQRPGLEDIEVGYSPKLLGYAKASLFLNKDISIAVNGTYVDEMYAYYDDTLDPPARLGEKVDSYFLLGANLRIRNLFGTGMFLNIRGSNLLDTEIHYPATSNNNQFAPLGTIGRGVSFLTTLGFRFIPIPQPQPKP
jgi:outer membrane receptor protein involved in Fe transport